MQCQCPKLRKKANIYLATHWAGKYNGYSSIRCFYFHIIHTVAGVRETFISGLLCVIARIPEFCIYFLCNLSQNIQASM